MSNAPTGERLHILIVHMRYAPDATGTAPIVTQLAQDLARAGDRVTVVTSAPHYGRDRVAEEYRGRLLHESTDEGVRIVRTLAVGFAPGSVVGRVVNYGLYMLLSTWAACRALPADVVLVVAPPITVGITGWITSRAGNTPFVFNAQDIWPDGLVKMGRLSWRPIIAAFHWLEKRIYGAAARVTVVSDGMRKNLIAKGVPYEKIAVLANWIDTSAIVPQDGPTAFRRLHHLEEAFIVMFAGNLGYAAGLDQLIDVAAILASEPEIKILLVGEGSARPDLEKMAADAGLTNLLFFATQPSHSLGDLLASADLGLVTLREGMGDLSVPSKTYAYMAAARPILAAVPRDSEVRQILEQSGCGECSEPNDPQALAEAVLRLMTDSGRRRDMGANGRVWVEQHGSRARLAASYRGLLHGIVNEGPRAGTLAAGPQGRGGAG
jgi:colanic acid biosynthesis glycosyl transferase WcaI